MAAQGLCGRFQNLLNGGWDAEHKIFANEKGYRSDVAVPSGTTNELQQSELLATLVANPPAFFEARAHALKAYLADRPQDLYNEVFQLLTAGTDTQGNYVFQITKADGNILNYSPKISPELVDQVAYETAMALSDALKKVVDRVLPPNLASAALEKMQKEGSHKFSALL